MTVMGAAVMRSRAGVFVIAIVLLAAATVSILVFTNDADSRAVAILLGTTLATLTGTLHTSLKTDQLDRKVDEVSGSVNGRMSQILDKVPDQPRDTTTPEGNDP